MSSRELGLAEFDKLLWGEFEYLLAAIKPKVRTREEYRAALASGRLNARDFLEDVVHARRANELEEQLADELNSIPDRRLLKASTPTLSVVA